jgi:hypothetical protein
MIAKTKLCCGATERPAFAETAETLSQDCFSHGPISPIDGWLDIACEVVETLCSLSLCAISGIVIPSMAMPSIFISPDAESWVPTSCIWQSEFIEANAQERSHAAASGDTDSKRAAIEPANMRLIIMTDSMLRQSDSLFQPRENTYFEVQSRQEYVQLEGLI